MQRQRILGPDRSHRAGERGAILAEFALVAPLLLMFLFGIIEFGLVFSHIQAVEAAAREAGRLATLSSTDLLDLQDRVDATVGGGSGPATVTVSDPAVCDGREGQSVTVTVTAPHRLAVPFVFDHDLTLESQSVFRCEA